MDTYHRDLSRVITASNIKAWVGKTSEKRFTIEQYEEIARRFTQHRWKNDPEDSPNEPWYIAVPDEESEAWRDWPVYWDIEKSQEAATTLNESIPLMLEHWKSLKHWPETKDGLKAIQTLGTALSDSKRYIDFPFGEYERTLPRANKHPKIWHKPAISIALILISVHLTAKQPIPSMSTNSVLIRIVQNALITMGYVKALNTNTISRYLDRWYKKMRTQHP